jgi:hypothetical protein
MIARGLRRSFQRRVLDWYAAHGRDLPWRRTRDPYAILVSEVLSHQTQIARVLPVYERLLRKYPSVTALARAPLAEVKAITDPLGYKIRGRWLHSAALRVADRPGATFPETRRDHAARAHRGALVTGCRRDSERQGLPDQPGVDGSGGDDLPGPSAALFGLPAAAQLRLQGDEQGKGHRDPCPDGD